MRRRLVLGIGILTLALALPAGALAAAPTSPFTGSWVSTDTDGSHQTLVVSTGQRPSVIYQDFYASGCDNFAGPDTHWVGAGTGVVEDGSCGSPSGRAAAGPSCSAGTRTTRLRRGHGHPQRQLRDRLDALQLTPPRGT